MRCATPVLEDGSEVGNSRGLVLVLSTAFGSSLLFLEQPRSMHVSKIPCYPRVKTIAVVEEGQPAFNSTWSMAPVVSVSIRPFT
jgi:hypothetical protein